jgi:hypothetical protein
VSSFQQKARERAVAAAFPVLICSLFLVFSALFEVVPGIWRARPQLILGAIGLFVLFTTGEAMRVVMAPIGKSLLIFTAWFVICIPFAIWRGGSFGVLIGLWYKSVLMFVLTAGLLSTLPHAKKLFRTIGYAVALMAMLALARHTYSMGRLTLPYTRFANSNDLAVTLLVGLTFLGGRCHALRLRLLTSVQEDQSQDGHSCAFNSHCVGGSCPLEPSGAIHHVIQVWWRNQLD